jgi:integrase
MFSPDRVDLVLGWWSSTKIQSASTHFKYTTDVGALLSRHGLTEEASYIAGLTKVLARLKEGRAAGNAMSPKVRRWCEALIRDSQKVALFDRQHCEYFRLALEALTTAKKEGFDLRALSDPAKMAALPDMKSYRGLHLLRRARIFGVLAAFAAIAIEGAPYRRQNLLSVRHTGPRKTIHLHLSGPTPYAIVKFPNEELKNGEALTARGDELDPVTIQKRDEGDFGPEILKFYLKEIRPLFPTADRTHCLFPSVEQAHTVESGLLAGTFDVWLAEGSAEIGLPLCSHNFRHGYCTIAINEGRVSIEDLAKIMGDTVAVLRKSYAWINGAASVVAVQKDTARRRAENARLREGRAR